MVLDWKAVVVLLWNIGETNKSNAVFGECKGNNNARKALAKKYMISIHDIRICERSPQVR